MARRTHLWIAAAVVVVVVVLLLLGALALFLVTLPIARISEKNDDGAAVVVVRVSGTQGTSYAGEYGPTGKEPQRVKGTLSDEPADYEVKNVEGGFFDTSLKPVSALFWKTRTADEGTLKVEILADGVIFAENETSVELGAVSATHVPRKD